MHHVCAMTTSIIRAALGVENNSWISNRQSCGEIGTRTLYISESLVHKAVGQSLLSRFEPSNLKTKLMLLIIQRIF